MICRCICLSASECATRMCSVVVKLGAFVSGIAHSRRWHIHVSYAWQMCLHAFCRVFLSKGHGPATSYASFGCAWATHDRVWYHMCILLCMSLGVTLSLAYGHTRTHSHWQGVSFVFLSMLPAVAGGPSLAIARGALHC